MCGLTKDYCFGEFDKSGNCKTCREFADRTKTFKGAVYVLAFCYYRPGITHPLTMENIRNTGRILGEEYFVYTYKTAYERLKV